MALIDSGATENFIDRRTAERWEMPTKELTRPRPIVNIDGTENKSGKVTRACILKVRLNRQEELQKFYITDLGFDRVLLGYPWLSKFNPRIDWAGGTVDGRIRISTVKDAWQKWKELRSEGAVAQACLPEEWEIGDEWEAIARTNFAQDWAREANKDKQIEAKLPEEYTRHWKVFDEEAAKRFPPARPEDHAIRLKPGAPSEINCKIYPLTKQELVATREFLDKNLELGYIEECDPSDPEGAPWSTPWFFTGKKDGGLRPLQDYRVVNSWTIRDVYPIP
jgi:hypothetical protein